MKHPYSFDQLFEKSTKIKIGSFVKHCALLGKGVKNGRCHGKKKINTQLDFKKDQYYDSKNGKLIIK